MGVIIAVGLVLVAMFVVIPAICVSGDISHYEDEQEFERMMREEYRK